MVDAFAWFKSPTSQNFRQFINLKGIEACGVLENTAKVPGMDGAVFYLNTTFPGMIHKCPYTNIDVKNGTIDFEQHGNWVLSPFPNGVFKTTIHLYDNLDDNIVTLTYFNEGFQRSVLFNGKAFME
jgi:hypothetical protein